MHAWIPPALFCHFCNILFDGQIYKIHNLLVTPYTCKYKCFESENHIYFTHSTIVNEVALSVPEFVIIEDMFLLHLPWVY